MYTFKLIICRASIKIQIHVYLSNIIGMHNMVVRTYLSLEYHPQIQIFASRRLEDKYYACTLQYSSQSGVFLLTVKRVIIERSFLIG